jgi:hypothetical protein
MKNPYKTKKGFGLRVHRAEQYISKMSYDFRYDGNSRSLDNCFEMYDGDAVVFALMSKAKQEPDEYGQSHLTRGIQKMFSMSLNAEGWPPSWQEVYDKGLKMNEQQQNLFETA